MFALQKIRDDGMGSTICLVEQAQCIDNDLRYQCRIRDWRQFDEPNPIGESIEQWMCGFQRQPRFAYTAWPRKGHQAISGDEAGNFILFFCTTNEGSNGGGQIR